MSFTEPEQWERIKTVIFGSVFVIRRINVNGQKRMFLSPFLYRNGVMWTGSIYATNTDHNKNGAVWTGP